MQGKARAAKNYPVTALQYVMGRSAPLVVLHGLLIKNQVNVEAVAAHWGPRCVICAPPDPPQGALILHIM